MTVELPTDLKPSLTDWLEGTLMSTNTPAHLKKNLVPDAKLFPLLTDLPPEHLRRSFKLPKLDAAAKSAFVLQPLKPPEPAAAEEAAEQAAASADIRQRIWRLSHTVYDTFTNEWPATWEAPLRANDMSNPETEKYASWPAKLINFDGCKDTLQGWRDAQDTPPATRQACATLMGELAAFAQEERKKKQMAKMEEAKHQKTWEVWRKSIELKHAWADEYYAFINGPINEELEKLNNELQVLIEKKKRKADQAAKEREISMKTNECNLGMNRINQKHNPAAFMQGVQQRVMAGELPAEAQAGPPGGCLYNPANWEDSHSPPWLERQPQPWLEMHGLYALLASLSHSGQELSGFGYERGGVLVGGADGVSLVRLVEKAKGKIKELEQVLQSAGITNKNYVNTIVKRLRGWKREFT